MDLDEWEFLSDQEGLLDFHHSHHQDDKKGLIDQNKDAFDMNYFVIPSPKSNSSVIKGLNQLVPISIELELKEKKEPEQEILKEVTKHPIVEIKSPKKNLLVMGEDQETISQVFFKKMKENEFVDMKLDSPKSGSRGIKTQIETGFIQFDDKEVVKKSDDVTESKKISTQESGGDGGASGGAGGGGGGLNIWRWRLTGIGALCSIGFTAATICILILGSRKQHKINQQNQKFRIQIFAEDKRIKQVVHHATKLNHAMAAARGVPLTRGHITFGGYYDGF